MHLHHKWLGDGGETVARPMLPVNFACQGPECQISTMLRLQKSFTLNVIQSTGKKIHSCEAVLNENWYKPLNICSFIGLSPEQKCVGKVSWTFPDLSPFTPVNTHLSWVVVCLRQQGQDPTQGNEAGRQRAVSLLSEEKIHKLSGLGGKSEKELQKQKSKGQKQGEKATW